MRMSLLVATLLAAPAIADSWMAPPTTPQSYPSENKTFTFVITPGDGRSRLASGTLMKGTQEVWKAQLLNPYVPLEVLVSNSGRYVATFDDYYGPTRNAVVLFDRGRQVAHFNLLDLTTERQRDRMPRSMSSVQWRRDVSFDEAHDQMLVEIEQGGNRRPTEEAGPSLVRTIQLSTGKLLNPPNEVERTTEQLIVAVKGKKDRGHALTELLKEHPEDPKAVKLAVELAADTSADIEESTEAARYMNARFTEADVVKLLPRVASADNDWLTSSILEAAKRYPSVDALPFILAGIVARARRTETGQESRSFNGYDPRHWDGDLEKKAVEWAGPSRDKVFALIFKEGSLEGQRRTFAAYAASQPDEGWKLAQQSLKSPGQGLSDAAAAVLAAKLHASAPRHVEAFEQLLTQTKIPGSAIAQFPLLLFVLTQVAIDSHRLDDASALAGLLSRLPGPKRFGPSPNVISKGLEAFIAAARRDEKACSKHVEELGKLDGMGDVPWTRSPSDQAFHLSSYRWNAEMVTQLKKLCGGDVPVRCGFKVSPGAAPTVEVELTNTTSAALDLRLAPSLSWAQSGDRVGMARLQDVKTFIAARGKARVSLPVGEDSMSVTNTEPRRADISMLLWRADGRGPPINEARCTSYVTTERASKRR